MLPRSFLLVLSLLLVAACRPQPVPLPPDPVTVQLKWVHQAQFAGFYVAREMGYYAAENLDVTFVEGGPNINIVAQVARGQATFGVSGPQEILIDQSQGEPVTAIAAIFRRSPLVFLTLADSGLQRPADFLGRRAALGGVVDGELQFASMLNHLGLDSAQVEIVPYAYDYTSFFGGDAEITLAYTTSGLIRMRQQGRRVNVIWPGDYGVHLYADTLIAANSLIAQNPELATRFLRATLKGWRRAVEDPQMAVQITLLYARETDADLQMQMMEASVPLIHTGEDQIGWMRPKVWQETHDLLLEQGLLGAPLELEQVYTLHFLEEIYGEVAP